MNVADQLQKLQQLHQSGTISDEEFSKAKAQLLNSPPRAARAFQPTQPPRNSKPGNGPCSCTCLSWRASCCPWPG